MSLSLPSLTLTGFFILMLVFFRFLSMRMLLYWFICLFVCHHVWVYWILGDVSTVCNILCMFCSVLFFVLCDYLSFGIGRYIKRCLNTTPAPASVFVISKKCNHGKVLRCEWGTPSVDHFNSMELFMNAGKYASWPRAIVAHQFRTKGNDNDDNNNKKNTKTKLRIQCVIPMENEKRNQQHKFIE